MEPRAGRVLVSALSAILLLAGCESIEERLGTQETKVISTRNERQGETYRSVFRPNYAQKTGIRETIVHLDESKIQFLQEFFYTPEYTAANGIERERWYEFVNGNLEKRIFFSPQAQQQLGPSEQTDLFNEQHKKIQTVVTYGPRHRQERGVASMLILYDVDERKEREELSFTAEGAASHGTSKIVTVFRDGRPQREIKIFTDQHAQGDGVVQSVTVFAQTQDTGPGRAERIELRYSEAYARQRGIVRCQRFMDSSGTQVTRSECFDRDGRAVTP
jgi:hypothetical protein